MVVRVRINDSLKKNDLPGCRARGRLAEPLHSRPTVLNFTVAEDQAEAVKLIGV